eukprot:3595697-Pyramimonas_sp.AAC.1
MIKTTLPEPIGPDIHSTGPTDQNEHHAQVDGEHTPPLRSQPAPPKPQECKATRTGAYRAG